MHTVVMMSYLTIFFEIFIVGLKTLHYQRRKKQLDKIKYEMISNLELAKQLCLYAGYPINKSVYFLTFNENIDGLVKDINNVLKYVNTKSKKKYKQDFINLQRRAKERHSLLLEQYNETSKKINYIIDKWPKLFKSTRPKYEPLLDESVLIY